MTRNQQIALQSTWWPTLAEAAGLDPRSREDRLDYLGDLVGKRLGSTNQLTNQDIHLIVIAYKRVKDPDNLQAAIDQDHPEYKEREVVLQSIKALAREICRLHALDRDLDATVADETWQSYVRRLARDLTGWQNSEYRDLPTATPATLTQSDADWYAQAIQRQSLRAKAGIDLTNLRNLLGNRLREYLRQHRAHLGGLSATAYIAKTTGRQTGKHTTGLASTGSPHRRLQVARKLRQPKHATA